MGLFRKTNKMLEPLIPANTPVAHKVMETLRSLEGRIDPDEVMLVGSAALVLYGVRLHSFDDPISGRSGKNRPGDLDFTATVEHMDTLFARGDFTLKENIDPHTIQTVLHSDARTPNELPVDVITRYQDGRQDPSKYDTALRKHIRTAHTIGSTAFRIISLDEAISSLQSSFKDPKAQLDLAAARQARAQQG